MAQFAECYLGDGKVASGDSPETWFCVLEPETISLLSTCSTQEDGKTSQHDEKLLTGT